MIRTVCVQAELKLDTDGWYAAVQTAVNVSLCTVFFIVVAKFCLTVDVLCNGNGLPEKLIRFAVL